MGFSISSALFNASAAYNTAGNTNANAAAAAAQQTAQVQQQDRQQTQQTRTQAPYVVQLTEAQQVYQLSNQGRTVPQIANTLSLSEDQVNSYLGISNSTK
jgi:DNA-binding NarL/FixJ family response regulator